MGIISLVSRKPGKGLGGGNSNTPKAKTSPTLMNLAWAAGFLEGEGWFGKSKPNSFGGEGIRVNQVNKEPVEKLQSFFGGSLSRYKHSCKQPNANDFWVWSVSGSRARGIMLTLFSFFSLKRKIQILAALGQI